MELREEQILLITRHFRGETSVEEERNIEQWLAESEQHKITYQELKFIWNIDSNSNIEIPNIDNAWEKVKSKTNIGKSPANKETKVIPLFGFNTFIKIAASIVLIIAAGYFTINLFQNKYLTVISTTENKKEITLPDGSKVTINKNSKLSYFEDDYNNENREVNLEGEAFFEVTKNPNKPFIVNGLLSQTKVLGTSFNVRTFKEENSDKIQVFTGKVSFSTTDKNTKNVILLPGDVAVASNGDLNKSHTNNSNAIAWKSNRLSFDNSTLKEVLEATNNYFDTSKVVISNPDILNCKFTGSFTNPQMEEIVKVISISMNLSSVKSDSAYVLSGEGCK